MSDESPRQPLDVLVQPAELARRLPDTRLRIVDLRRADAFAAGHVDGAISLEPVLLNRKAPPFAGLLPDADMARQLFEAIDLREGQQLVAVDEGRTTEAARLAWVMEAWSAPPVAWLAGGMAAWRAEGLPVVQGDPAGGGEESKGDAAGELVRPALLGANRIEADRLLTLLDEPDVRILDVRGAAEFAGTDVRSAMGGHVPGARHYEWTRQFDVDGRLRNAEDLLADLAAIDVDRSHRVVVYCQSHQRSAVTWRVLTALGFEHVQGLDGAWSVWGNRPDLPKSTGMD